MMRRLCVSLTSLPISVLLIGIGFMIILGGCGPTVPREELGEILTVVPPEFEFQEPYPVPWVKGFHSEEGSASESEVPPPDVESAGLEEGQNSAAAGFGSEDLKDL